MMDQHPADMGSRDEARFGYMPCLIDMMHVRRVELGGRHDLRDDSPSVLPSGRRLGSACRRSVGTFAGCAVTAISLPSSARSIARPWTAERRSRRNRHPSRRSTHVQQRAGHPPISSGSGLPSAVGSPVMIA